MNRIALAACALASSCTTSAPAMAAPTFPERGRAAVVDAAGIIPAERERALNERIVSWVGSTGNQLVVATVPSLDGQDIADYGYRLGRHWGLGKDESAAGSTGVILLLAPNERKVRIEVGYGLEGSLTDAVTSDILRRDVVPSLKAGDQVDALENGAAAIMEAAASGGIYHRAEDRHGRRWIVPSVAVAIVLLFGSLGLWLWLGARRVDRRMRAMAAEHEAARYRAELALHRKPARTFAVSTPAARSSPASRPRPAPISAAPPPPAPPPPPKRRDDDDYRPSSYSPSASDWSAPSSGWSSSDSGSSSSSGFDSGGGSFGGGGSDSSY